MGLTLDVQKRNAVLRQMAKLIDAERELLLQANEVDIRAFAEDDVALFDRLKVDDAKIDGMIASLEQLADSPDPLGEERYSFVHGNGMQVSNRTAPFGTVLIIYESRPDVTIEAAGIAFKSGNKILLKGGKEAKNSNLALIALWHRSLEANEVDLAWVTYLDYDRGQIREFLEHPDQQIDLIVPRGGERLIAFVKQHATCPVVVSGRGNNFLYVDTEADLQMAVDIIINGKTTKISACNALDKVLVASDLPRKQQFLNHLIYELEKREVEIHADASLSSLEGVIPLGDEQPWFEEFLDYKIVLGQAVDLEDAIAKINRYSGGHSATIVTANGYKAQTFMDAVDAAAVYHNVSTRFTDGGQFGLGGELAISTEKLHQRGPIGLQHLVTNKWYVTGDGQTR